MTVLELEVIKETPQKRITLVRELDKRTIYIKKELKAYNKEVWKTLKELDLQGIPHIYSLKENEEELERNFRWNAIAVAWEHWACREIFPVHPVLPGWLLRK